LDASRGTSVPIASESSNVVVGLRSGRRPPRYFGRTLAWIPLIRMTRCAGWILAGRAAAALRAPFRAPGARAAAREERERREGELLAAALGDLKGPYAKLGQFASLRYDALPPATREALATLRDAVPPLPFPEICAFLEAELGRPLETAFAELAPEPLGAASIAEVHRARLPDGRAVAVKVQYPWLRASLPRDLALLRGVLALLALGRRHGAESRRRLFDEFARGIAEELDFAREAAVAAEIARNLAGDPGVVVPEVVASHSTGRVLTMSYRPAVPILDRAGLRRLGVDPAEVLEILARAYARQVFVDGLFHADPHPGNLFVLEERGPKGPQVLFVDFGLSRRLAPELRREMRLAIFAVLQGDVEAFLGGMERMSMIAPGARAGVRDAVVAMFERLRGESGAPLALGASRVLALKDEAKVLLQETSGLVLPNDLLLYAKTLSYLFALGAELAPEVDMMKLTVPWLLRFLAEKDPAKAAVSRSGAESGAPAAG
jgi:predicted unusual protein kinase regulating ubiquinone biosynthesis (AarF/ABC1/UbiB family)